MSQGSQDAVSNWSVWDERYRYGTTGTRYPFDNVVSFVMRRFGRILSRSSVSILDFGCGSGNHLKFLVENGFSAYGVDISPEAVRQALQVVRAEYPEYPLDRVMVSDGKQLPCPDSYFDAVIDRSSLGQNRYMEIAKLVNEIHRVLKPNGVYFGVNFSDLHPDLKYGSSLGQNDFCDFSDGIFKGIGGRHFFGCGEVRTLFSSFKLVDLRLIEDRSLMGGSGNAQLVVVAEKMD